jgi:hypothetical protein
MAELRARLVFGIWRAHFMQPFGAVALGKTCRHP